MEVRWLQSLRGETAYQPCEDCKNKQPAESVCDEGSQDAIGILDHTTLRTSIATGAKRKEGSIF
jgi:hypothetical protein